VLPVLRQFAMTMNIAELNMEAQHAELAAAFLSGVRERHRPGEVAQTAMALARSKAWEQALQRHGLLLQAPSRPGAWQPVATSTQKPAAYCDEGLQASRTLSAMDGKASTQKAKRNLKFWKL